MRGLKSTIALVVVLIGLGSYIYFVTWKQSDNPGTPKLEKVFPNASTATIDEIEVQSKTGEKTTIKKQGDTWQITSPLMARAAETAVQGVTATLVNMEVTRVIDEKPTDLKQYGLDPAMMAVTFKASDDKTTRKIAVGDRTATGGGLYAKRDDEPRIFLIPSYQEAEINKSTFDLRDKAIVSMQRDKVDGAEVIVAGMPPIELKKSGSDWTLTKPVAAKADAAAVDSLIARVETAQMKSIVTEQPTSADLKKYGLDKPDVTVNVLMGGQRTTLLVGAKAGDDNYAKDASGSAVVTVEPTLIGDLKKPAGDYRPKNVFEFKSYNATHLEITRGKQTLVLDRVKGQGENAADSWKRTSPNPGTPDKAKVDALLASLADLSIVSFNDSTAKTGLDAPVMTVTAKVQDAAKEEKVSFGKSSEDIYVARAGDSGAGKIDAAKFNEATKTVDELLK